MLPPPLDDYAKISIAENAKKWKPLAGTRPPGATAITFVKREEEGAYRD
jgi:hypothetical protein